jgi:hypothetical protein
LGLRAIQGIEGNISKPIESRLAGAGRNRRCRRFHGRFRFTCRRRDLGNDALAAFLRERAMRRCAASIREADKQNAWNPDRSRAKRENGLKCDQARKQR